MPEPQNQSELRSFLGMVQYYDRFIPGLAKSCAGLNDLLQKIQSGSGQLNTPKQSRQ